MKLCSKCQSEKELIQFHTHNGRKDKLQAWCKDCDRKNAANTWRRKQLGFTREQYNELLEKQEYRCAICNRHQDEFIHELYVDHNHVTMLVRGILCVNCNFIIGHAKDNIDLLRKSIIYLGSYSTD